MSEAFRETAHGEVVAWRGLRRDASAARASALSTDVSLFEQQKRATLDLIDRVLDAAPRRIGYLHGDPWTAAALIARQFPDAEVTPLDPSRLDGRAGLAGAAGFDLIICHGDLERLPALRGGLPELVARLRSGGRLAAQFPDDLYQPFRALARLVAADGPWAERLLPVAKTRPFDETMEQLFGKLKPVTSRLDIWETVDLCAASGIEAIVEFMKATILGPFLAPLDEPARGAFFERYRSELARAYAQQPDGSVLLRFPRIGLVAWR